MKDINKKFVDLYEKDTPVDEILEKTGTDLTKRAVKARIYRNTEYRQGQEIKWGRRDCEYCGEEFKPTSSESQRFCSEECYGKNKNKKKKVECEKCGKEVLKKKDRVEKRKNLYCSNDCYYEDKKEKVIGENNSNWKGGSSYEEYPEKFNKKLKRQIRERDNHTCQMCGASEEYCKDVFDRVLEVHHLDENKQNCDKQNLISVCRSCHGKLQNEELAEKFNRYVKSDMSRKKGYRRENQCVKTLQKSGYESERSLDPKYSAGDWFGLFDVMGVHQERKPVFIQVKSNGTDGALKQIKENHSVNLDHADVEVWSAYDRKGWRIHRLTEDGWKLVVDERDSNGNYGEEVVELYSQN